MNSSLVSDVVLAVLDDETSGNELSLFSSPSSQPGVLGSNAVGELLPQSLVAIALFPGRFLLCSHDSSMVSSAAEANEFIPSGSGDILKFGGISWGQSEWKRLVRVSSVGLSQVYWLRFPRVLPM